MKDHMFEKPFLEIQEFLKTSDRRTKKSRDEIALAKQEFLVHVKELAEEWFDERLGMKG